MLLSEALKLAKSLRIFHTQVALYVRTQAIQEQPVAIKQFFKLQLYEPSNSLDGWVVFQSCISHVHKPRPPQTNITLIDEQH